MSRSELDYLRSRAETELRAAKAAAHPEAAKAHSLLAGLYLDRVHGNDDGPRGAPFFSGPPHAA